MKGSILQFPGRPQALTPEEGRAAAAAVLSTPIADRVARREELHLEDPEQLLAICDLISRLVEVEPARARDEATLLDRFLDTPCRSIGLFDARDYDLGEFGLIAGGACRILARREDARRWFDLADASFVLSHNASAHVARVAYQRLALK